MVPILEEHDLIEIIHLLHLDLLGCVYYQRSHDAISGLDLGVSVVPIRAELIWDGKIVEKALARWDGTLGDASCAVHPVGAILKHAMPVYCGGIWQFIRHVGEECIATVQANQCTWELAIDREDCPIDACGCEQAANSHGTRLAYHLEKRGSR